MKKVAVVVLVLAISIVFAVVPVMAAPAQKVSFTAIQIPNSTPPPQGEDFRVWVTEGDTFHTRNQNGAGTIKIWTTNSLASPPNYVGTTSSKIDNNINLKTGEGMAKFQMTWTLPGGTFEGNIIGKLTAPPFTNNPMAYSQDLHGVLHGTGDFEGQTAMFDGTKPAGQPFTWTGTIIIP